MAFECAHVAEGTKENEEATTSTFYSFANPLILVLWQGRPEGADLSQAAAAGCLAGGPGKSLVAFLLSTSTTLTTLPCT